MVEKNTIIQIAIVYYSQFGHTQKIAEHIHEGILSKEKTKSSLITAEGAVQDMEYFQDMDAIIFGSPTYMGSVAADFKKFMDASSPFWLKQLWKDKVAAGFTNSHSFSGDKLNTLIQLSIFAAQHSMIWVGQSQMNSSPQGKPGDENALNRMGSMLGYMAQSENISAEITPPRGDLETAKLFGKRIAEITHKFR